MENISDLYYNKLDSSSPGNVITTFYGALFDRKTTRREIIMFNKFIKLYGRYITFFSVMDMLNLKELDHSNLYGVMNYYCKKRFEKAHPMSSLPSSTKLSTLKTDRTIESLKKEKLIVPDVEELE